MLIKDQHFKNKSITIALLGAPNVGKSTLVNAFLGFDLSPVTPKAQTTRNRFTGVFIMDYTEVILVDTPGIHASGQEMNIRMNGQAFEGAETADLNFLMIDLTQNIQQQFQSFFKLYPEALQKTWVLFNKSDQTTVTMEACAQAFQTQQQERPELEQFFVISAKQEENLHLLYTAIEKTAESSPHRYRDGAISNKSERFFVAEYIREQAFLCLKEELPYELTVVIEDFQDFRGERDDLVASISAVILVNRPSQRAIVIGAKGSVIKKIGTQARAKVEALLGGQVGLNLHVKVSPRWFKNNYVLEEIGLPRVQKSARVWKKR